MRGHCPFCIIYTIASPISKSLAIPITDTTFFQRYCIKCKEDRKENVRNKIVNAKRRRKKLCAEN